MAKMETQELKLKVKIVSKETNTALSCWSTDLAKKIPDLPVKIKKIQQDLSQIGKKLNLWFSEWTLSSWWWTCLYSTPKHSLHQCDQTKGRFLQESKHKKATSLAFWKLTANSNSSYNWYFKELSMLLAARQIPWKHFQSVDRTQFAFPCPFPLVFLGFPASSVQHSTKEIPTMPQMAYQKIVWKLIFFLEMACLSTERWSQELNTFPQVLIHECWVSSTGWITLHIFLTDHRRF